MTQRTVDERSAPLPAQSTVVAEPLTDDNPLAVVDHETRVPQAVIDVLDLLISGEDLATCAASIGKSVPWLRKELAKEPARLLVAQREREASVQRGRKALANLVNISMQRESMAAAESAARFLAEAAGLGAKSAALKRQQNQVPRSVTVKLIRSGDRRDAKAVPSGLSVSVNMDNATEGQGLDEWDEHRTIDAEALEGVGLDARDERGNVDGLG